MKHFAPQQLSLGLDEPGPSVQSGRRGATPTERDCAARLIEFLLHEAPGCHGARIDTLFEGVLPSASKTTGASADILTHHLLGFCENDPPSCDTRAIQMLSDIWAELIAIAYDAAFPGEVALESSLKSRRGSGRKPAFRLRELAISTSYDTTLPGEHSRHADITRGLSKVGLRPLMLCLRDGPDASDIRRAGWDLLQGEAALDQVRLDTGVDLEAVIYFAAHDAGLAARRAIGRSDMEARLAVICATHYRITAGQVADLIHREVALNPERLADLLSVAMSAGTLDDALANARGAEALAQGKHPLRSRDPIDASS